MRQNMDISSPVYRFYAERVIRNLVEHYRDNPTVIGWQIDNETSAYGASNRDVFVGFVNHLREKFGTTDNLNKAWFLNYWGEDVKAWEDMPTRDSAQSTGYKLEWSRWEQMRMTDFLHWQAALVRQSAGRDQFVTTDFGGMMHHDVNEEAIAESLDIAAINIYHGTQDHFDGAEQSINEDFTRSLKGGEFPGDRDQRANHWLEFGISSSALRRAVARGRLHPPLERREYGGVLALGLDCRQPGDLLEGRAVARSGT